jgi:toxin ParE1/3/4
MTPSYSIRALARADLEEIWFFTFEEWGLEQADKYLNSLFSRFKWLTKNPYTGKDRGDIKNGYYCFPEGMHLVFYTMTEYGIDIIGIPHQNMDVSSHF